LPRAAGRCDELQAVLLRAEQDAARARLEAKRLQRALRKVEAQIEDAWAHVDALDSIIHSLRQQVDEERRPPA
jgi:outer membrane protein TolC